MLLQKQVAALFIYNDFRRKTSRRQKFQNDSEVTNLVIEVKAALSFIIVNWNGGELLKRCIDSIYKDRPSVPCEIIVVDNASTDGSREWLKSQANSALPAGIPLRIIQNDENVGFGKANNQAFAQTESDFLFLLNADAELTPRACDMLLKTLISDERIGACGPRINNPDGSLQISVWRNPPTACATLLSGLRLASLLPRRLRGELLLAEYWDHNRRRTRACWEARPSWFAAK